MDEPDRRALRVDPGNAARVATSDPDGAPDVDDYGRRAARHDRASAAGRRVYAQHRATGIGDPDAACPHRHPARRDTDGEHARDVAGARVNEQQPSDVSARHPDPVISRGKPGWSAAQGDGGDDLAADLVDPGQRTVSKICDPD